MALTLKAISALEEKKKLLNNRSGTILESGAWRGAHNAKEGG